MDFKLQGFKTKMNMRKYYSPARPSQSRLIVQLEIQEKEERPKQIDPFNFIAHDVMDYEALNYYLNVTKGRLLKFKVGHC